MGRMLRQLVSQLKRGHPQHIRHAESLQHGLSGCGRRQLGTTRKEVSPEHLKRLNKLYGVAPINGLFNEHVIEFAADGSTSIKFSPKKEHCHTMQSLHGSGYFKLLDDAAFFAAQALDEENFIFTTSFNTYLVRAAAIGVPLISQGRVISAGKTLLIAESRLIEEESGKLVATGSGTFQKSPHAVK